ncbi:FAD-binding oxidoreductase [Streptomyces sp. A7024]|uniref:D-amino-acid oxidase n=1 Tax=Streptomyces coryli TaxID=1128680 RepID=A0A6G4U2T8_9ACTN|nr:FAD-binding oxidoreductase [Streptomyces coryli]
MIVIGSGVIGLTTAVRLAETGRRVAVWTRDPAERSTSAVSGGLWWPYRIEPMAKVSDWALRSYDVYAELAADPAATGVRMVSGVQAGVRRSDLGSWADKFDESELRTLAPEELPKGYDAGLRTRVPLIDMPAYLRYLRGRLEAAGGRVEAHEVRSLADVPAATVVHCSGLGARELAGDEQMRPIQGQLVLVDVPGVTEWFVGSDWSAAETVYAFPQPYGLVLGGTARDGEWGLEPDPATARAIVDRAAEHIPAVRDARILGHRVGLRPWRPSVRLETERLDDGRLCVHNYGHGGAGVTVAWGCAEEAAGLVV